MIGENEAQEESYYYDEEEDKEEEMPLSSRKNPIIIESQQYSNRGPILIEEDNPYQK